MQIEQEQAAVLKAVKQMTHAFHQKDLKAVMNSYEDQALVVFEPESPITDKALLEQMFQGAFSLNPKFTYSGHEVFVNGDIAVHIAPWTMKGKAPDGSKVEQSGLSIAVLRKQKDGKWLMVFDDPHGQFLMTQ
ncbi:MAG: DUF4440 domain-containing protein [Bacteroidia bacterium]|nr:DUF4440 domain-containing protein [Bacteroidia bacterium]